MALGSEKMRLVFSRAIRTPLFDTRRLPRTRAKRMVYAITLNVLKSQKAVDSRQLEAHFPDSSMR